MSVLSIAPQPTMHCHPVEATAMLQLQEWHYAGVMARYMFSSDPFEHQWVCRPQSGYWQIRDHQHELVGFAIIGSSAQMAGVAYAADAIDIVAGLRPDLIGHKHGYPLVRDVVAHTQRLYPHKRLRVTIPSWHLAALAVWQRAGFFPEYATIAADGTPVVVLL
ncbi:MAG: hypothetical protein ACK5C8_06255 [Roseiflexaceae bacterium]|jgi:hypothetical protein|nr:hypothetical protein [Chloroflexaceae bacterium]MCE2853667.1 hypothetical protein [Chloroflexaceae bacterium]